MDRKAEKRERFEKLAPYRTQAILDRLAILRNCANRSAYYYSSDEVKKIFEAIEDEVARVKSAFEPKRKNRFRL